MKTVLTGFPLDLRRIGAVEYRTWGSKGDAVAALVAQREQGHNCDPTIEAHQARGNLALFWVLGWPDHYNGVTYLMRRDGSWTPGRQFDGAPCFCAAPCRTLHLNPWAPLDMPVHPATFTHVTRTVPDVANRHERYRTKSNGSCGRWVRTDESVALCTCGWKRWEDTRDAARWAARRHRESATAEESTAGLDAR